MSRDVSRRSARRAILHLIALIAMLAAASGVATPTAYAKSSRSKSESTSHARSAARIDINTASENELEGLPGVGSVMAQKIIAGRPYKSVQDLKHAGIPASTIKGLSGRVKAGRSAAATTARAHRASEASERRSEAAPARSSAAAKKPARSFFGIPIGGSSKPEPKEEPAPAAKPAERERGSSAPRAAAPERPAPPVQPPAKGMVWVNSDSKVYHFEGDRWYGATKHGKFMWEDQAIRDGYRASKTGSKK